VELADGRALDCSAWHGAWPADCWRFLTITSDGRTYRLHAFAPAWWRDLGPAVRERAAVAVAGLAPIEVVPLDDGALVVAEALPSAALALAPPPEVADEEAHLASFLEACRTLCSALA